jgi:release factor glutamine methyltransferase
MSLLRFPGVYAPQHDTRLLVQSLGREPLSDHARVLDICTGTGALAVAAARGGARYVTAVDISWRAVWTARANAFVCRIPLEVRRGHLLDPVKGERFSLVLANPPYVPTRAVRSWAESRRQQSSLLWDAGIDGRALLDPLCAMVPRVLTASGVLLLVQSAMCGVDRTLRQLQEAGLQARVRDRLKVPFGPVMRRRARWLEERGHIRPGQRDEELVVIRASRS